MHKAAFFFLYTYILLVFIRPQEFVGFLDGVPIVFLVEILAVICWLGSKKKLEGTAVFAVIFLTASIGISWLTLSVNVGIQKTIGFIFGQALVLIMVCALSDNPQRHRALLNLLVLGALTMSFHAIGQMADPDKIGWTGVKAMVRHDSGDEPVWQASYLGIFNDPNDMGMILAAALPIITYQFFRTQNFFVKLCLAIAFAFVLNGIYLCNSRGTILAALAPVGVYGMIRYNLFKLAVPALMAIPVLIAVLPSRFFISNDASSQGRIEAWYEGYVMFKNHPVFGVGMDKFLDHHHKTAHNSWVLAYAELGFVGFYFWMLMIFSGLFGTYYIYTKKFQTPELSVDRQKLLTSEIKLAGATMLTFIAILSASFFLSRTYSVLIYILAGLSTASVIRIHRNFPEIKIPSVAGKIFVGSLAFIVFIALIVMFKS